MALPGYRLLEGSEHAHPADHALLGASDPAESGTVTLLVRRRAGSKLLELTDFSGRPGEHPEPFSRADFAAQNGADPADIAQVEAFARGHGLTVVESDVARRSVVVNGTVASLNAAFGVALHDYRSPRGKYRGYAGALSMPAGMAGVVEAVFGLDNRKVPAQHYAAKRKKVSASPETTNPPNTAPVTPQQIAALYGFPPGDGAGQTIGIYEMETGDGPAGYTTQDLADSIAAFGGNLKVPKPVDVSVDGVTNSGKSDGETGLDITVAGAIAQGAELAVYFTGGDAQNIIHALQLMFHPGAGDPQPTIVSISYGWGPDDEAAAAFSAAEYAQLDQLFQDAANLGITVLVSSGDSGAFIESTTQAQASYPATEPWVIACGGTTVGNIAGASFDEYAWNNGGTGGASGGGISARYPVPSYQSSLTLPVANGTKAAGRGIPDLAGNANEDSGYPQFINGQSGPVGGTSAVAPLYAGLLAIVNANLGRAFGFINPILYALAAQAFSDIVSPPGPANNSYNGVTGYAVGAGWDAVTGLGSIKGTALQAGLKAAPAPATQPPVTAKP